MSDTRTLDDSLNESEKLISPKNEFWANENETFATSEATTRLILKKFDVTDAIILILI